MTHADIVVIGAGSVGANVAYGSRSAARASPCSRPARREADVGRELRVDELVQQDAEGLSRPQHRGHGRAPRPREGLGVAGWRKQDGAIAWEDEPVKRAHLKETVERLRAGMIRSRSSPLTTRASSSRTFTLPRTSTRWSSPERGYVEVVPLVGALLAHAARRGARVLSGQRVTA